MALTPEDVVKKEFSKPKGFGRSGYDEIQVDDFLDEIVVDVNVCARHTPTIHLACSAP